MAPALHGLLLRLMAIGAVVPQVILISARPGIPKTKAEYEYLDPESGKRSTFGHEPWTGPGADEPPPMKLYPAIDWFTDPDDLDHLIPNHELQMFWHQHGQQHVIDPTQRARIGRASYVMNHKAVYLGHSSRIQDIKCGKDGTMTIMFGDMEAYSCAKWHWPESRAGEDHELFIATYLEGCGKHFHAGRRSWTLVNDIMFDDMSMAAVAKVEDLDVEQALKEVEFKFGEYVPTLDAPIQTKAEAARIRVPSVSEDALKKRAYSFNYLIEKLRGVKETVKEKLRLDSNLESLNFKEVIDEKAQKLKEKLDNKLSSSRTARFEIVQNDKTGEPTPFKSADGKRLNETGYPILPDMLKLVKIKAWCVGCRFGGEISFDGNIKIIMKNYEGGLGFEAGSYLKATASLDAQYAFGFDSRAAGPNARVPYKFANLDIPLPFPEIPIAPGFTLGFLTIGPFFKLELIGKVFMMLRGLFEVGMKFSIPSVTATFDLHDISKSTFGGWSDGVIRPILHADGDIDVGLSFALPFSFNFGIIAGKFGTRVYVAEGPALSFTASQAVKYIQDDYGDVALAEVTGTHGCNGTALRMRVSLDTTCGIKSDFFPVNPPHITLYRLPLWERNWCWAGGYFHNDEFNGDGFRFSGDVRRNGPDKGILSGTA